MADNKMLKLVLDIKLMSFQYLIVTFCVMCVFNLYRFNVGGHVSKATSD